MAGAWAIPTMPKMAMTMNQSNITGPNSRPIQEVPLRWIKNRTRRMTRVSGTTKRPIWGAYSLIPSTALNTEIAGVMVPSPYSKVAPISPTMTMTARHPPRLAFCGLIRARRARMPPSPWLLARMMRPAYLTEITTISDQKINDTIPSTASGEIAPPGLAAFTATCRV